MEKLTKQTARVDLLGRAVIPSGVQQICFAAFEGNDRLRSVRVPGTVEKIGSRAFADCPNLHTVVLEEGIEEIEGNVFTGCSALSQLVLPDSLRTLDGWAFYQFTGLREPAYNRAKTILYCYPCTATEPVFTVPAQVQRINNAAFLGNPHLQQVNLPEGLTTLETRTFLDLEIRRVIVPASVKRIQPRAFWNCKNLEEVVILGEDTVIEKGAFFCCPWGMKLTLASELAFDERLHLFGHNFLVPVKLDALKNAHHKDPAFLRLAKGSNDPEGMWKLADYFDALADAPFYQCAANFWRYRACQYGHPAAAIWRKNWLADHPHKQMPSILNETLEGHFGGARLRDAGFLFFDPERSYSLTRADADGIVEASAWSSTEDADEDGFGMEECYDWWLLDEHLNPIPGIEMIHDFSPNDRRANEARFQNRHDRAAACLRK